ncbi:MAG TPA: hypothetical protein VFL49_11720, partial [Pseudolabrys sp.]|nr:hypothetical protein [Pseudolabrys sp.]
MRKALVFLIAFCTLAFIAAPARAKTIKLSGTHTRDEIKTTCEKNGGTFDPGAGNIAYGCIGKGGSVYCNKKGTCAGVCENCGGKAAPGKGGMGGILTSAPAATTRPLEPQRATRSPGRVPA